MRGEVRSTTEPHVSPCFHITLKNSKSEGEDYLIQQEGNGSEGEGPAILVGEVGLVGLGPVQHLIVDTGDVQHQTDHQRKTWSRERPSSSGNNLP